MVDLVGREMVAVGLEMFEDGESKPKEISVEERTLETSLSLLLFLWSFLKSFFLGSFLADSFSLVWLP